MGIIPKENNTTHIMAGHDELQMKMRGDMWKWHELNCINEIQVGHGKFSFIF